MRPMLALRSTCAVLIVVGSAIPARTGVAQTTSESAAQAEALFREGRVLIKAGQTSEACAKFAESQRLDPQTGTLLNLALCHEDEGKTASAWAEFNEVSERSGATSERVESQDGPEPGFGATGSDHAWDVFGNIGYDFASSPTFVFRPFVGFGTYRAISERCWYEIGSPTQTCESTHASRDAELLGAQLLFDVYGLTLGGELRLLIKDDWATVAALHVGAAL
jgi:hypothetical protein